MSGHPLRSLADILTPARPNRRGCPWCRAILDRANPACADCRDGSGSIERARAIRRMSIIRPGDREAEIESRGERENGVRAMEDGRQ